MFEFEFVGADKGDIAMTKDNKGVFIALGVCALLGGLVAGFIIRYLMKTYFPVEEKQILVKQIKPSKEHIKTIAEVENADVELKSTAAFPKTKVPFYKK